MALGICLHVVYKAPRDFPDNYVVRKHYVTADKVEVEAEAYGFPLTDEGLEAIRTKAAEMGLTWLERQGDDDPVILGCYI